jgi:hypothetical protein
MLREHQMQINHLNTYMNSFNAKAQSKNKILKNYESSAINQKKKEMEKKNFLNNVLSRFRAKMKGAELPACSCKWPEITGDGASSEQRCPPVPIKCEICMNAVNAVRFKTHPINYCETTPTIEKYHDFCVKAGNDMVTIYGGIQHVVEETTMKFGALFGASKEICLVLGCCKI